ncbi:hypothetical protein P3342_010588 [Pyrenophora teres f. teres]|nr:hypothetical protein P3342_010588 [Pyrenophora teres f. teres]
MSEKPTTAEKPPESPTTARELDFDDDDAPASATTQEHATAPRPSPSHPSLECASAKKLRKFHPRSPRDLSTPRCRRKTR